MKQTTLFGFLLITLSQSLSNVPVQAAYNSLTGNKRAQTSVIILSVISRSPTQWDHLYTGMKDELEKICF